MRGRTNTTRRRGFSLLEVTLSIIILALLAAVIVPRMASIGRREARLGLDSVADLLVVFAFRDGIAAGSVALEWNAVERELILMRRRTDQTDTRGVQQFWERDRSTEPVVLPVELELIDAWSDQYRLGDSSWTIESREDGTRPRIEIIFEGSGTSAAVLLESYAASPRIMDLDGVGYSVAQPFDLDAAGQERDPW